MQISFNLTLNKGSRGLIGWHSPRYPSVNTFELPSVKPSVWSQQNLSVVRLWKGAGDICLRENRFRTLIGMIHVTRCKKLVNRLSTSFFAWAFWSYMLLKLGKSLVSSNNFYLFDTFQQLHSFPCSYYRKMFVFGVTQIFYKIMILADNLNNHKVLKTLENRSDDQPCQSSMPVFKKVIIIVIILVLSILI